MYRGPYEQRRGTVPFRVNGLKDVSSAELCANACTENNECTAFSYKASTGRCLLQNSGDGVDLGVHVESKQFSHYVEDAGCATTTTTTDEACTETGLECNMQAAVDMCCEGTWCQEGLFGGNSMCLPDFTLIEGQRESTTEAAMTTISIDTTESPDLENAMTGTVAATTTSNTMECTPVGGSCVDTQVGDKVSKCCEGTYCGPDEATAQPVCIVQITDLIDAFGGTNVEMQPDDTTTAVATTTTTAAPTVTCDVKLQQRAYCDSSSDELGAIILGSSSNRNQECRIWCETFGEDVGCCSMYQMTSNVAQCTAHPLSSQLISASWAPYNYAAACGTAAGELRATDPLDVSSASSSQNADENAEAGARSPAGSNIVPIILAACAGTLLVGLAVKVQQRRRTEAAAKRQSTSPTFSVDSLDRTADASFFGHGNSRNEHMLSVSPPYPSPEAPSVTPTRSARSYNSSATPSLFSPPAAGTAQSGIGGGGGSSMHKQRNLIVSGDDSTPYKPKSNAIRMRMLASKIMTPNGEYLQSIAALQNQGQAEANNLDAAPVSAESPAGAAATDGAGAPSPYDPRYSPGPGSIATNIADSPAPFYYSDAGDWDDAGTPRPLPRGAPAWGTPLHHANVARLQMNSVLTPNSNYLEQMRRLRLQQLSTPSRITTPAANAHPTVRFQVPGQIGTPTQWQR